MTALTHGLQAVVTASLLGLASCSTVVLKLPSTTVSDYKPVEQVPIHAVLQLGEEFQHARWEGGGAEIPLGENLCRNAEAMVRGIFSTVSVVRGSEPMSLGAQALIIPKVVGVEQASGMFAWNEASATLLLEWTVRDAAGQTVWVDTIKGEGFGKLGTAFSQLSNAEARNAAMVEDAFRKSHLAISAAPAIRSLALSSSGRP